MSIPELLLNYPRLPLLLYTRFLNEGKLNVLFFNLKKKTSNINNIINTGPTKSVYGELSTGSHKYEFL